MPAGLGSAPEGRGAVARCHMEPPPSGLDAAGKPQGWVASDPWPQPPWGLSSLGSRVPQAPDPDKLARAIVLGVPVMQRRRDPRCGLCVGTPRVHPGGCHWPGCCPAPAMHSRVWVCPGGPQPLRTAPGGHGSLPSQHPASRAVPFPPDPAAACPGLALPIGSSPAPGVSRSWLARWHGAVPRRGTPTPASLAPDEIPARPCVLWLGAWLPAALGKEAKLSVALTPSRWRQRDEERPGGHSRARSAEARGGPRAGRWSQSDEARSAPAWQASRSGPAERPRCCSPTSRCGAGGCAERLRAVTAHGCGGSGFSWGFAGGHGDSSCWGGGPRSSPGWGLEPCHGVPCRVGVSARPCLGVWVAVAATSRCWQSPVPSVWYPAFHFRCGMDALAEERMSLCPETWWRDAEQGF